MTIEKGNSRSEYGRGVNIHLTGDEVAMAIIAYLAAHGVHINGPRTVTVNEDLCRSGSVYIDPSGFCIDRDGKKWDGREKMDLL